MGVVGDAKPAVYRSTHGFGCVTPRALLTSSKRGGGDEVLPGVLTAHYGVSSCALSRKTGKAHSMRGCNFEADTPIRPCILR
jgi:hypothetical protein